NPGQLIALRPGVRILDAQTGREVRAFAPDFLLGMSFSSDGKRVATLSSDMFRVFPPNPSQPQNLQIDWWDVETGERAKALKLAGIKFDLNQGFGYYLSRDGKRLAAQWQNEVHLIQAETGENIRTFNVQRPMLVALSANGSRLAALSFDGMLTVWD